MVTRNIILVVILLTFTFLPAAFSADSEHAREPYSSEPVIRIKADPSFGPSPLTVTFDANDFHYHYGEELSFSWNFDDGATAEGPRVSHTFGAAGTYVVALRVNTPFGVKNAWEVVIVTPE